MMPYQFCRLAPVKYYHYKESKNYVSNTLLVSFIVIISNLYNISHINILYNIIYYIYIYITYYIYKYINSCWQILSRRETSYVNECGGLIFTPCVCVDTVCRPRGLNLVGPFCPCAYARVGLSDGNTVPPQSINTHEGTMLIRVRQKLTSE